MLKIIRFEDGDSGPVLKLEGKVAGAWVPELGAACSEELARDDGRLTLDLSSVSFVDGSGVALIRELVRRQVALTNCSAFTTEQLKGAAHLTGEGNER